MSFQVIDDFAVDHRIARVYEHGWQSWSPTTSYPVTGTSYRPASAASQAMRYRSGRPAPATGFQGEGLLAVDCGDGQPIRVYAMTSRGHQIPSIRAAWENGRVRVRADGPVQRLESAGPLAAALGRWAGSVAGRAGIGTIRPAPTVWCSWYHYFTDVTEADILENLDAIGAAGLPYPRY